MRPSGILLVALAALPVAAACFGSTRAAARQDTQAKLVRAWHPSDDWRAFWHAGKAEITRYRLSKSRYGENHEGEAVLIFVTEELHPSTHVKYEGGDADGVGAVPVLKLNRLERFATGVYDYSMMASVFTPEAIARNPRSLKVTASSQEWCGQVWLQANLAGDAYRFVGHSYFEGEADQRFETSGDLLEDEIWNRIRIDPESLPVGEHRIVPGSFDSRLRHYVPKAERATARLGSDPENPAMRVYSVDYASGRSLSITFESAFPHRIEAFEESFDRGGARMRTSAVRSHRKVLPYWRHNRVRDAALRRELGLR